jgi:hypothetical protein
MVVYEMVAPLWEDSQNNIPPINAFITLSSLDYPKSVFVEYRVLNGEPFVAMETNLMPKMLSLFSHRRSKAARNPRSLKCHFMLMSMLFLLDYREISFLLLKFLLRTSAV